MEKNCSICEAREVKAPTDIWCPDCDEYLCSSCNHFHTVAKITKHHKTVSLKIATQLKQILMDINTTCEVHHEKLEFFCIKHNRPFCVLCTPEHKQCDDFSVLRDFQSTGECAVTVELVEAFSMLKSKLVQMIKDKSQNIHNLEDQYIQCKKHIKDMKVTINRKVDEIETSMLQELESAYQESKLSLGKIIESFEANKQNVERFETNFNLIKENATNIHIFLGIQKYTKEINHLQGRIEDTLMGENNKYVEIVYTSPPDTSDVSLQSLFGKIDIKKKPCNYHAYNLHGNRAQLCRSPNQIDKISLKQIFEVDLPIKDNYSAWGCCYTDDGSILITDHINSNIFVLKEDGSISRKIELEDKPNKIVYVKGNVYVSSHLGKTLTSIEFNTDEIIKKIQFDVTCDALTPANNRLIINVGDKEFKIFDLNLNYVGSIPIQSGPHAHHMAYFNWRLYFCDWSDRIIFCYDMKGQKVWELKDPSLPSSSACSVDSRGNVFAGCWEENNIIVASPDGKRWRNLVSLGDMNRASALYIDQSRSRLLVLSDNSPRLREYEIQY